MSLEEIYSVMKSCKWDRRGRLAHLFPSSDGKKGPVSQFDFVRKEHKAETSRLQISNIFLLELVDFLPQIL